jgi:hypothetical protein
MEQQHEELEENINYHTSKQVHQAVGHLDNRMVEESDHVVDEVDKNQLAHHGATTATTAQQAAGTVDEISEEIANHHAAVHQTVKQSTQGLAGYVEHLSDQVNSLRTQLGPWYDRDPIIARMKSLEANLNELQNQVGTTTVNPIQQELKALSDGLQDVRSAMISTTATPTAKTDPDAVTEHLSGLKKALEVAGATTHMQALKDALLLHGQPAAVQAPIQQPVAQAPVPQAVAQQVAAIPGVQNFVASAAPVQQAVAPAAVVAAEPPDSVTQHLMALKNSFNQPAPAQQAPAAPVAPAQVHKQITPEQFHQQLRALTEALPPQAR